jgi:outer membrane protein OmpA-like peptidoglycan-associated protein
MLTLTVAAAFAFVSMPLLAGATTISTSTLSVAHKSAHDTFNLSQTTGTPDQSEPSGYAPPGADALPGFQLSYVNDFIGSKVPSGWGVYTGVANGDPGSQWALSHVVVSDGMLQLNTYQDPAYGNEWVNGGLCQCGVTRLYGAYFIRSRVTGPGSTQVELLWPAEGWPPEIDFNETGGGTTDTTATLHFTSANSQIHNSTSADMTQWHTWGVIWTPTSVTYTMDGTIWGQVNIPADIPDQLMWLTIQQQTWCDASPAWACPTADDSTEVDWVAEYSLGAAPTTTTTTNSTTTTVTGDAPLAPLEFTVRPFAPDSSILTTGLKREIDDLATRIATDNLAQVTLTGYSTSRTSHPETVALARARALNVEIYLRQRLADLRVRGVKIIVKASPDPVAPTATAAGGAASRRVVALVR